eukprot:6176621-Pleurochrysis_carterae.AAC.1
MRPRSLRALAAIASSAGMQMRRWDFVAAYLQGDLGQNEVVYCHAPPGYATLGSNGRPRVCRVEKSIYGLAQAGRRWQRSLFSWLLDFGFTQCGSDPCVFTMTKTVGGVEQRLTLDCYVDDFPPCTLTTATARFMTTSSTPSLIDGTWKTKVPSPIFSTWTSPLTPLLCTSRKKSISLTSFPLTSPMGYRSGYTKPAHLPLKRSQTDRASTPF